MMEKLITKIESTGWFGGELQATIKIKRTFEGYHGRASETWETQYEFVSNEIKSDSDKVQFPAISLKSNRFEAFNDFMKRIENLI